MGIVIVFVVLLGGVTWYLFYLKNMDRPEQESQRQSFDETLYDPVSGEIITLEQAQHGYHIDGDVQLRIKSDHEIEEFYTDEERELEYVKRFFAKNEQHESDDETVIDHLHESEMAKQFDSFGVCYHWELKPSAHLAIIQIMTTHLGGGTEYQMVFVFQSSDTRALQIPNGFRKWEYERAEHAMIFRCPKKLNYNEFTVALRELSIDGKS